MEGLDLRDETVREALAEQAYMRERAEDAALDREHNLDADAAYYALSWDSLDDWARRPYRSAVATVCDALLTRA